MPIRSISGKVTDPGIVPSIKAIAAWTAARPFSRIGGCTVRAISGDRPGADDLVVMVFEPTLAEELVRLLRERNAPGRFIPCTMEEHARAEIANCHVLVAGPFPTGALEVARSLRWIQSLWAGVDSWHGASLPPGVRLTRMTEIHAPYMAEYVFAHLLSSTQRVADFRAAQSEHRWQPLPMRRLTGPLGVAGWGSIGSRIGHIAAAFGLTVRGLRRGAGRVASGEIPVYGAAELDTFLDGLQVLVTVLPATAQTRGLIGEDELGRLAQGAVLVNVGRGDVLDERAVLRALNSGRLSRAVLDTFATEPLPPASPLWEAPRCVVTPHIAGPTDPAEAADVVARNLVTFLAGDWPEPVVDFAAGY